MAKLFKVTTYIVDANDEFEDAAGLEACLVYDTQNHFWLNHTHIDEADIGEWEDEHPLNYIDCPEAEFTKYFKEN